MASEKWSKGIRAETFDDGAFVITDGDGAVLCQRSPWPGRIEESRANGVLFGAASDLYHELDMQVRNCPMCKGTTKAVDAFAMLSKPAPHEETDCTRCASARAALSRARQS